MMSSGPAGRETHGMVKLYLSTTTALGVSHPNNWHPALDPSTCLSHGIRKDLAMWGSILEFKAKGALFTSVDRVIETK